MPLRMAFNSCVLTIHGIAPAPDTICAHLLPAHLAHVARGKACAVREIRLQKLCRCDRRAWDVLLFRYISTVFRTLTRFSSQGLNGKYEACFVEVNFIST